MKENQIIPFRCVVHCEIPLYFCSWLPHVQFIWYLEHPTMQLFLEFPLHICTHFSSCIHACAFGDAIVLMPVLSLFQQAASSSVRCYLAHKITSALSLYECCLHKHAHNYDLASSSNVSFHLYEMYVYILYPRAYKEFNTPTIIVADLPKS